MPKEIILPKDPSRDSPDFAARQICLNLIKSNGQRTDGHLIFSTKIAPFSDGVLEGLKIETFSSCEPSEIRVIYPHTLSCLDAVSLGQDKHDNEIGII